MCWWDVKPYSVNQSIMLQCIICSDFLCMAVNVLIDFQNSRNSYNRLLSVSSFGFSLAFSIVIIMMPTGDSLPEVFRFQSVCVLCPCVFMHGHILKVCENNILQTTSGNFTKFTTQVHLATKGELLDFEVRVTECGHISTLRGIFYKPLVRI